jgi:hypothetical protein
VGGALGPRANRGPTRRPRFVRALKVQPLRPPNEKTSDIRRDDQVEGAAALPRHIPNLREARVGGGLSTPSTQQPGRREGMKSRSYELAITDCAKDLHRPSLAA